MLCCYVDGCPGNADVRLETEGSSTDDDDGNVMADEPADNCAAVTYAPRQALRQAVIAWLPDFFVVTSPGFASLRKPMPGVMVPPPAVPSSMCIAGNKAVNQMAILEVADAYIQPIPAAMPTSSLRKLSESETESLVASSVVDVEPMDCAVTPGTTPASVDSVADNCSSSHSTGEDNDGTDTVVSYDDTTSTDNIPSTETMQIDTEVPTSSVTVDDVMTIVDMFYLPFEHGPRAVRLLSDFFDIKLQAADSLAERAAAESSDLLANCCHDCDDSNLSDKFYSVDKKSAEWHNLVRTFLARLQFTSDIIDRILAIPNKSLAYELFPYLWDIKAVVRLLDCFVQWLGKSSILYLQQSVCYYYLRQGGYVFARLCLFVCLSVCLCVSKITQKVMDGSF